MQHCTREDNLLQENHDDYCNRPSKSIIGTREGDDDDDEKSSERANATIKIKSGLVMIHEMAVYIIVRVDRPTFRKKGAELPISHGLIRMRNHT